MRIPQTHKLWRRAFSLLELSVVNGILGITAGLVSYSINPNRTTFSGAGRARTGSTIASESTSHRHLLFLACTPMNRINPSAARLLPPSCRALTLLELLIVVSILAILTTVATRSLVSVGEQTQFETNDALCRDFRRALIGMPNSLQSDGTPMVNGFIADLGRPPRAELEPYIVGENEADSSHTGNAYTLRELVSQRFSPQFRIYKTDATFVTATSIDTGVTNIALYDSTNSVAAGWRGPYLQGGNDEIIDDGWGKPLAAYSVVASRTLVNLWITSYQNTTASPPSPDISPFVGISLNGYHDLGSGFGNFPADVVGAVIRPGPASTAATGNSLSLAAYSNTFSAGVVWTNEYVAQLLCNITFNTNTISDPSFTNPNYITNYHYIAGVIMYGPNPFYSSPAATVNYANSRPVAVAYLATGGPITAAGVGTGMPVYYPAPTSVHFISYPCQFASGNPGFTYPLVQGQRVVKPFMVAVRKDTVPSPYTDSAPTQIAFYAGSVRNLVLRPGSNTVQLSVP